MIKNPNYLLLLLLIIVGCSNAAHVERAGRAGGEADADGRPRRGATAGRTRGNAQRKRKRSDAKTAPPPAMSDLGWPVDFSRSASLACAGSGSLTRSSSILPLMPAGAGGHSYDPALDASRTARVLRARARFFGGSGVVAGRRCALSMSMV